MRRAQCQRELSGKVAKRQKRWDAKWWYVIRGTKAKGHHGKRASGAATPGVWRVLVVEVTRAATAF